MKAFKLFKNTGRCKDEASEQSNILSKEEDTGINYHTEPSMLEDQHHSVHPNGEQKEPENEQSKIPEMKQNKDKEKSLKKSDVYIALFCACLKVPSTVLVLLLSSTLVELSPKMSSTCGGFLLLLYSLLHL